jgi:hypothetical protein
VSHLICPAARLEKLNALPYEWVRNLRQGGTYLSVPSMRSGSLGLLRSSLPTNSFALRPEIELIANDRLRSVLGGNVPVRLFDQISAFGIPLGQRNG